MYVCQAPSRVQLPCGHDGLDNGRWPSERMPGTRKTAIQLLQVRYRESTAVTTTCGRVREAVLGSDAAP